MPATRDCRRLQTSARPPFPRRRTSSHVSPHRLFPLAGVLLATSITAALHWGLHWSWVWAYVLAINLATAALYVHDKRSATAGRLRVPERVLHVFAIAG